MLPLALPLSSVFNATDETVVAEAEARNPDVLYQGTRPVESLTRVASLQLAEAVIDGRDTGFKAFADEALNEYQDLLDTLAGDVQANLRKLYDLAVAEYEAVLRQKYPELPPLQDLSGSDHTAMEVLEIFDAEGRAALRVPEHPQLTDSLLDMAAVFRRDLYCMDTEALPEYRPSIEVDIHTLEVWSGEHGPTWTLVAERRFAWAFIRYYREGKAPTPQLQTAFDQARQTLRVEYPRIKGSPLDVPLTTEIRGVFARLLGAERPKTLAHCVDARETPSPAVPSGVEERTEPAELGEPETKRDSVLPRHCLEPNYRRLRDFFQRRPHLLPSVAASALLVYAMGNHPKMIYETVHVVTTASALLVVSLAARQQRWWLAWVFGLVALLFNPVSSFSLKKADWRIANGATASVFGLAALVGLAPSGGDKRQE